jgi:S-formylglutathione hydrolase FrmB
MGGAVTRTRAALLSPALFRSWGDASSVHGFANQAQWAEFEPLRHISQLPPQLPLGIWCGREDPFYPAASQLAASTRPIVASFPHGEHDDGFWRRVLPDALTFIGGR